MSFGFSVFREVAAILAKSVLSRSNSARSTLIIVELRASAPGSAAKRLTHFSQTKLGELQAENASRYM